MPRNIAGPPAVGDDCFGRRAFIESLQERLQRGSVLLAAPRRWGKTSVLRTLAAGRPGSCHYFDLYSCDSPSDLVARVAAATAGRVDRVGQWVGGLFQGARDLVQEVRLAELSVALRQRLDSDQSWERSGQTVLASLPADHILVFDEFPVMAKALLERDRGEGVALLRWLRVERQGRALRMIFAGSTSLGELCRQASLSDAINDLQVLALPPFDAVLGRELLRAVFAAEATNVESAALEAVLELVGPEVPFFLQLFAQAIIEEARRTGGPMGEGRVRSLYRQVLLAPEHRSNLDDFRGRLDRTYLAAEREVALIVLGALCRQPDGLVLSALRSEAVVRGADERLLERVLALLEGDFYVRQDESGRYRFFNRYLADWWRKFHGD